MDSKQLRKAWRRVLKYNLARAMALLRRRGPLNAEAVHDLRVSLRRARLLLQLCSKNQNHDRIRRFRAAARKIMDAFGPVRDLDVVLDRLRNSETSSGLLARILSERATRGRRAERKLARSKPKIRSARASTLFKTDPDPLARRYHRWRAAMATHCQIEARCAARLSTPQLHALRRDLRRWRYLRELLLPRRQHSQDETVRVLVAAQEKLGAIQDAEVILATLEGHGRSREVTALKAELKLQMANDREAALAELKKVPDLPASG